MLSWTASHTAALACCLLLLSLLSMNAAFVSTKPLSPAGCGGIAGKHAVESGSRYGAGVLPPAIAVRGGAGRVQQVVTQAELEQVLSDSEDALVVVDFTATWCGPCQKIAPAFEQLSEELTDVVFLKVDVDENEETAQKYEVNQMPTFLFVRNSEVVDQFAGASIDVLRQKIEELS
ncbi:unnamed protein product [Pylaiella littoralis]